MAHRSRMALGCAVGGFLTDGHETIAAPSSCLPAHKLADAMEAQELASGQCYRGRLIQPLPPPQHGGPPKTLQRLAGAKNLQYPPPHPPPSFSEPARCAVARLCYIRCRAKPCSPHSTLLSAGPAVAPTRAVVNHDAARQLQCLPR